MPEIIRTKVRGVTRGKRQEIIEKHMEDGDDLFLEREPDNIANPNAIAVHLWPADEEKIGYLSDELADELAPLMDVGQFIDASVLEVTGRDKGTLGVNIQLSVYSKEETAEMHRRVGASLSPKIEPIIPTSNPSRTQDESSSAKLPILFRKLFKPMESQKSKKNFFVLLILWFFTGYLGGHRLYAGRSSWLYTLTFGYLLIGWMIDFVVILFGRFTDNQGLPIRVL